MTYTKEIYTAFMCVWVKLWFLGDCNCAILHRGCASQQNEPPVAVYIGIMYRKICDR